MTKELFDKVDEKDNIIGVTYKQEAHEKGFIHRVAAVYVFDKRGNLYVQDHVKAGLLDHSVGGHIIQGESYQVGASREAKEELGIGDPVELLDVFYSDETYTGSNYRHMFGLFTCTPSASWHFKPNDEVHSIFPMSIEDIVNQMNVSPQTFTPGFLNTMEQYLKIKKLNITLNLREYKNKID
ncbi:MAG: NUDIX domain-containing protein [Candidatus Saccharibacteria bacterium]|nr:NUDIX domain-containing protein [Candidatus Saccharibacteria bacterium]